MDFKYEKALDLAIEKVKTQLKKLKSKVMDHRKPIPPQVIESEESEETEESEEFEDFSG